MQGFGDQIFSSESGLEIQKLGNDEFDDDGKPKRTGKNTTIKSFQFEKLFA